MQLTRRHSFPPGSWLIRITMLVSVPVVCPRHCGSNGSGHNHRCRAGQDWSGGTRRGGRTDEYRYRPCPQRHYRRLRGGYFFSPVKIGNDTLSASLPASPPRSQDNVHLSIQQRLEVNLQLQPGAAHQDTAAQVGLGGIPLRCTAILPAPVLAALCPGRILAASVTTPAS
jgi:hypothetical protein